MGKNKPLASSFFLDFWKPGLAIEQIYSTISQFATYSSIPKLFEKIEAAYLRTKLSFTVMGEQFSFLNKKSVELN